ncbi:MAG: methionyl-tRNA formyltransferase [Atopobiaceae bacterium]|nr:methionyl-tRNA formyltransferase [Atopobiaceae bacterium]
MRVVFMGTPDFAVPSLRAVDSQHEVMLVVTRPDAVRGRGRKLVASPVKAAAVELGLPVLEASRATDEMVQAVLETSPEVIVVAAYGAILPSAILECASYGCINVHASLLPRGRGAAPIQRALLEGDDRVGVSIMRLVQAMDAGPYCRQASIEVGDKPCNVVMDELAKLGAKELLASLDDMAAGRATWHEQDEALATYVSKVEKREMQLDPADSALVNKRRVQASTDAAPARVKVGGRGLRVMDARVVCVADVDGTPDAIPVGEVCVVRRRVLLGCAESGREDVLELLRVKPDGKREMDASAWSVGIRGDNIAWERV